MKQLLLLAFAAICLPTLSRAQNMNPEVRWDRQSLIIGGKRVVPVMGEVHYSRIPAEEWQAEVHKIKEGGVTMIATYVFWNHIEEQQGVFNWSGQRDLRRFIEVCKAEEMPVVLRIGPFCHGEVRCGGIPDWVFSLRQVPSGGGEARPVRSRSTDPQFLVCVERFYRQIFAQVQGLQWKDGGPIIACQFDNEYRGPGEYLMALKHLALGIGFDLPFYTRTGWPALSTPVPYGELLPLYGDYADGFWERSLREGAGSYYKAFNFKAQEKPATDMGAADAANALAPAQADALPAESYPYFTCELGGGMTTAYHRRPYIYPEDAYAMAVVKLGSGSNLLGYYMYHGGTNPESTTGITLHESVHTLATANNDMNVKSYDFQAPLGEFGQRNPHYYLLRKLHLFMHDWGEQLAPMEPSFPAPQDIPQGDDTHLRWAIRSNGTSGFIFINNYERLRPLSAKRDVQLSACGVTLPKVTIPAATTCIFPVGIDGIRYATGQLIAKRHGNIYLEQVKGIPTTIALENGKTLKNVKPRGTSKPVYGNIYLLTPEDAGRLFLSELPVDFPPIDVQWTKTQSAGAPRKIVVGKQKVAEAPTDDDFRQAAVYTLQLPADPTPFTLHSPLLTIRYRGDVARLYADGHLIDDNFYNGRPFCYALSRLPKGCQQLELRILPLQPDMPVYLPREADKTPGEEIISVTIE